jgi:SAM-dependent methyltransferase
VGGLSVSLGFRSIARKFVDRATRRILGPSLDKTIGAGIERDAPAAIERLVEPVVEKLMRPTLDRYDHQIAPERLLENRYLSAKLISPPGSATGYSITPNYRLPEGDDLPVPPQHLWDGYGETADDYLAMGREHIASMGRVLADAGFELQSLTRILDFGCAAGRMLRFLPRSHELWGVDIRAETINWAQRNLPFNFATVTTFPHLPFEDNHFDIVYAGSVFTHIIDQPDAWFLELRRIVRRGGFIYLTILDKHSLEMGAGEFGKRNDLQWFMGVLREFDEKTHFSSQDFGCVSFEAGSWGGFPVPQVFYDAGFLGRKWSRWAKLVSTTEEAYGWQTVLLFQK